MSLNIISSPSMLLQVALFHSFLWLNNILLCICVTTYLSIPLSMDFPDNIYLTVKAHETGHSMSLMLISERASITGKGVLNMGINVSATK